jgi:hypothetical protein
VTFADAIRSGFGLIHKQWQLVAVHAVVTVIYVISFFILVGIPLVIALIAFGIDIATIAETQDVLGQLKNPAVLFTKYLGLALIVVTSFFLYIVVATTLWVYVLGGSAGMVGRTVLEPSFRFSMNGFFGEARKLFFPLMWFLLIIGLVFIAALILIGIYGAVIVAVVSFAKSQDSTLAVFLGIFSSLVFTLATAFIFFITLVAPLYGIAALFFKREGAFKSVHAAFRFLWDNQKAFWLYVLLFLGYFLASFMLMLIIYPLQMIPFVGSLVSLPIQILSSVAQSYLGLVMMAVLFVYYYEEEVKKPLPVPAAPDEAVTEDPFSGFREGRSQEDISGSPADGRGGTHQQKDENEQT